MTVTEQLKEFHTAFNHPVGTLKLHYTKGLELRKKLIEEESKETDNALSNGSAEEILKELCDLVYVAVGTAVALGYDFDGAFNAVHLSNMSKLGADGKPVYRDDGKVIKGPNYQPPDLKKFVGAA